jgi:hypothetical protein
MIKYMIMVYISFVKYGTLHVSNLNSDTFLLDWTEFIPLAHSPHNRPQFLSPENNWDIQITNPLIAEQLQYNATIESEHASSEYNNLNDDQRHAFDSITQAVIHSENKLFFLHGHGGTGKTRTYNTICAFLRGRGLIVLCIASSGIAALLIHGGRTAHSMFKIPIDTLSSESFCSIPKNSQRAELLCQTSLILWDEVGPQHRHAIEAVDCTCQDIRDDQRPFGGISVVLGGDFLQTLPVIPHGERADIVSACIRSSPLWNHVEVLQLRENMRLRNSDGQLTESDRHFASWLLEVGYGNHIPPNLDTGEIPLPADVITTNPDYLISSIYSDISSTPPPPPEYFLNRNILAPRNADVMDLNDTILSLMSGEQITMYSADSVVEERGADFAAVDHNTPPIPPEFLRSINSGSLPPGELKMKIGCPLILLCNIDPANGLCNGTRLILLQTSAHVLEVRIIGGDHGDETAFIPRISLYPTDTRDIAFKFRRRQFPVRLAFAMSINKAQGQSVHMIGLDLRQPVFAHGQLYVALSRATSYNRIKILLPVTNNQSTSNVVYKDILLF